jgi:NAD(P)H dehydrogenase (quinone)
MNVLWIFAHPEIRSLNGSLQREGVAALTEAGHHVEVSDLYAMKWNPVVDREDYDADDDERLFVAQASKRALECGTLSADVRAEHEKLARADLLVTQFPLWWFGVPAILKGWLDRVLVKGYAYSIPDPERPGRSRRYGDGGLEGKRALAVVTVGGSGASYQPRGIDGQLEDVLFPLLHGTFFYTGMKPLPPVAVYSANHMSDEEYRLAAAEVRSRLLAADETPPIPYRPQNSGEYDDNGVLLPHFVPGESGLGVHRREGVQGRE